MEKIELGESYPHCFACGKDNSIGLRLSFHREAERVVSECTLSKDFQGFPSVIHGGIACVLLDEVMAWTLWAFLGRLGLTRELTVSYRRPLRVGKPVKVFGWIESHTSSSARVRGEIQSQSGLLCVEGAASFGLLLKRERIDGIFRKAVSRM